MYNYELLATLCQNVYDRPGPVRLFSTTHRRDHVAVRCGQLAGRSVAPSARCLEGSPFHWKDGWNTNENLVKLALYIHIYIYVYTINISKKPHMYIRGHMTVVHLLTGDESWVIGCGFGRVEKLGEVLKRSSAAVEPLITGASTRNSQWSQFARNPHHRVFFLYWDQIWFISNMNKLCCANEYALDRWMLF